MLYIIFFMRNLVSAKRVFVYLFLQTSISCIHLLDLGTSLVKLRLHLHNTTLQLAVLLWLRFQIIVHVTHILFHLLYLMGIKCPYDFKKIFKWRWQNALILSKSFLSGPKNVLIFSKTLPLEVKWFDSFNSFMWQG